MCRTPISISPSLPTHKPLELPRERAGEPRARGLFNWYTLGFHHLINGQLYCCIEWQILWILTFSKLGRMKKRKYQASELDHICGEGNSAFAESSDPQICPRSFVSRFSFLYQLDQDQSSETSASQIIVARPRGMCCQPSIRSAEAFWLTRKRSDKAYLGHSLSTTSVVLTQPRPIVLSKKTKKYSNGLV